MPFNLRSGVFAPQRSRGYSVSAKAHDTTEIFIYDEIGFFGIRANDFVADLRKIKTARIDLRLNSPGGSVFDGHAIYNALREHPATVVTHIDALAASISSVIALAGDEVVMAANAFLMIHEPWSIVIGPAEDMRKEADLLDKITGVIADVYVARSDFSQDEVLAAMAAETWFTAEEAEAAGLVDSVADAGEASARFDLSIYEHVPDGLAPSNEPRAAPTQRDLERSLRDAGLTRTEAKAVLAEGLTALAQRDADDDLRMSVLDEYQHNATILKQE